MKNGNNTKAKLISIVAPVFNEEPSIAEFYRRLDDVISNLNYSFEIIFVDDGSRDKSLQVLREIIQKDNRVKFLSFSRNFGHQIAITAGMKNAQGDAVIVMDGDLQHPPELIPRLITKWEEGFEIVSTIRKDVKNIRLFKKMTAALFYKLINRISDTEVKENAADFRLLDRKVVNTFKRLNERGMFVRGLVGWLGYNQTHVEFVADVRFAGETKYSVTKMIKFALDGIMAFSSFPLRVATHLGVLAILVPLPYTLWAVYARLFTEQAVPGWASILVAIIFLGGVQLITIGIIGQYIARIYDEVKGRPLYIVKEMNGFDHGLYDSSTGNDSSPVEI